MRISQIALRSAALAAVGVLAAMALWSSQAEAQRNPYGYGAQCYVLKCSYHVAGSPGSFGYVGYCSTASRRVGERCRCGRRRGTVTSQWICAQPPSDIR